jgi:hypothetical protein
MKRTRILCSIGIGISGLALGQGFSVQDFDSTSAGPWSAVSTTVTGVAKVPNGSVNIDGKFTAAEYGNIPGVTVTPGDNAWLLDFPADRQWDGPEDSSFTFWLAHDDDNLYVAIKAQDDIVNSDDTNDAFWKDDSIEILVDAFNDRYDINTDSSNDEYGGHNYVNYLGRFSRWDDATDEKIDGAWSTGVDWAYGEDGDIFGIGDETEGGWEMEVRFNKRMFESPDQGNKLSNGARMGFNIGLDDDDKFGIGTNGDGSRTQDLELQYFWANRERTLGWNEEEKEFFDELSLAYLLWEVDPFYDRGIDSGGRLTHGGTGEIIFGFDQTQNAKRPEVLYFANNADASVGADPYLISLLNASYNVTIFVPTSGSAEEAQATRDAAAAADLVILSESIGSGSVVFDDDTDGPGLPTFVLKDTDVPVISFEAYMWEDADWVKRDQFVEFGNTGRNEVPEEIQDALTHLYIQSPEHPMAGGLKGKVKVYDAPFSANWAKVGEDATVVISVMEDGSFPSDFVYDKGDKLVDGSIAPNKRIGIFLGQGGNLLTDPDAGGLKYSYMSEDGRSLFMSTVAYAIGAPEGGEPSGGETPSAGGAITGINVTGGSVVIEGTGTVGSADSPEGPYSGNIPLPATIAPDKAAQFYKSN